VAELVDYYTSTFVFSGHEGSGVAFGVDEHIALFVLKYS
jgi:hypothetical protein